MTYGCDKVANMTEIFLCLNYANGSMQGQNGNIACMSH